ncbi:MAG: transcription-repair coupling factor [Anaerolineae bacterium]|nr:transcription-repair coupling factor [Anaerolineae bacterium]
MKLTGLLALIRDDARYHGLLQRAREIVSRPADERAHLPSASLDLLEAARPYLLAALQGDWPGPVVVVAGRPEGARALGEQIQAWSEQPDAVSYLYAPDTIFYDRTPWDGETVRARVAAYVALAALGDAPVPNAGRGLLLCTSVWALMAKSVPPMAFRRATRRVAVGDVMPLYSLLERIVRAGYDPAVVVEEPGTFSHRGSIVDIYPPQLARPVRLDFFGDEVDSIRSFDPSTQRSEERLREAILYPASEALPEWGKAARAALERLDLRGCNAATRQRMSEEREALIEGNYFPGIEFYLPYLYPRPATLLDYLPPSALVLLDDMLALESAAVSLENQALNLRGEMVEDGQLPEGFPVPYFGWDQLKERLAGRRALSLGYGIEGERPFFQGAFVAAPRYGGQVRQALSDIAELRHGDQRVVLVTRQAERLADLLREQEVYVEPTDDILGQPEPGTLQLVDGILAEGWAYPDGQLVMLTDAETFGWVRVRRAKPARRRRSAPESLFADLQDGDYVVHVDYGIGRYHGMTRKTINALEREYLEIEYAAGDRLYVPMHQADRVSRYLGADEREPYLHRLGGAEWMVVRAKAEKAVRDIAEELLELYAAREVAPGHAFGPDTEWQHELENSFAYEETDDQLRALAEIKADMELAKPMDRLVCGDVGYGKTEVALRAAFKAVMDGKQVAVLVPTTVLAQQHFYTFRRRLRAFPVVVEMLSRFRSDAEQTQILSALQAGSVDIVIGTHRLLSRDVDFRDLGLVIIDEEQRFGVSHKEHLKQMRREVDVLTLTATPIPRTLHMSLSGVRDMSIIDTPPEDRLAVRTYVAQMDEGLIRKAILREIDRGGQVYFVHNRVQDIENTAAMLRRVVPEASVIIGHGQMPEGDLAQVMLGFAQGEHDVLLCTTIIESGLDIPNVNTIIIDRADTFGLAQLYQLRGRVGRGVNRAYAYLFFRPPLTDVARKRLQTIQEASELGAGFRVAMRDMEIRGAGEILGAEQHGHIAAIGFDLYMRLLRRAVQELQEASGDALAAVRRAQHSTAAQSLALGYGPSLDLPLSAHLPDDFIPESSLRLRLYRRLARVEDEEELDAFVHELTDRFGELPDPVEQLLYLLRVRVLAAEAGVESIRREAGQIALALPLPLTSEATRKLEARHPQMRARGSRVWQALDEAWQPSLIALLRTLTEARPEPLRVTPAP